MKNKQTNANGQRLLARPLVCIALIAAIGFSFAACDFDLGGYYGGGGGGVPSAPTGLSASAYSPHSIRLSWYSVSGASGYYVYTSYSLSGSYTFLRTSSSNFAYDDNLPTNVTRYYRVKAYNRYGESAYSNTARATTLSSSGALSNGVWHNGTINSNSNYLHTFSVTRGTTYYVWWNDSYSGNGSKTCNIYVKAYYSNGGTIFYRTDSAWSSPRSFTANRSGTVILEVEPYSYYGTYAIAYRTINSRP